MCQQNAECIGVAFIVDASALLFYCPHQKIISKRSKNKKSPILFLPDVRTEINEPTAGRKDTGRWEENMLAMMRLKIILGEII